MRVCNIVSLLNPGLFKILINLFYIAEVIKRQNKAMHIREEAVELPVGSYNFDKTKVSNNHA